MATVKKILTPLFLYFVVLSPLWADLEDHKYYESVLSAIQKSNNEELKEVLQKTINNQKVLSYKTARRYIFGELFLQKNNGRYEVVDAYCDQTFGRNSGVGPNKIPNHQMLNCEHTWPQSRFSSNQSKSAQKSDLHHLFPVKSQANSTRGNIEFAEVQGDRLPNCIASKRGSDINSGNSAFEPPKSHKGNVARALFYFAVRYRTKISAREEVHLRSWHRLDPVDADELKRHERIFEIQGNRNPFIDDPDLVDQITDL
jgi:deoxyribonuclease-1